MEAQKDRFGGLGKETTVEIAPDEEDGDFLGDAAASAHNLRWQERGQVAKGHRPI